MPSKIVCCTDFSPASIRASEIGAELARTMGRPVELLHAYGSPPDLAAYWPASGGGLADVLEESARKDLAHHHALLERSGLQIEDKLLAGYPDQVIVDHAVQTRPWL